MNKSLIMAVLATIGAGALLLSCSKEAADSIDPATGREATLTAPIEPYYDATGTALATRVTNRSDDNYGFSDFTSGDHIGLYVQNGDATEKYLTELVYEQVGKDGSFVTHFPDGFSFSDNNVFAYYPWDTALFDLSGDNDNLENREETAEGMPLRKKENGDEHCVDLLLMRGLNKHAEDALQLNSLFKHAFSELLLVRGEGFDLVEEGDKPKNNADLAPHFSKITDIVIELEDGFGYDAVKLTSAGAGGNVGVLKVVLLPTEKEKQSDDDRYWVAWQNKGTTAGNPVEDGAGRTYDRSWSVILPTMADPDCKDLTKPSAWKGETDPRTVIRSIKAYDNNGVLQTITDFSLLSGSDNGGDNWEGGNKVLSETWRYNLIIEMQGTVPTISPWSIEDWKDDQDLTDTRRAGINDAAEFVAWLQAYTTYLEYKEGTGDLETVEQNLLLYGDRVLKAKENGEDSDETDYWQFYVHTDLDWKQVKAKWKENSTTDQNTEDLSIKELYGVLDFREHTVTNFESSGGFIGELNGKNAAIKNAIFQKPVITPKTENADYVGCIVDDLYNGSIINCQVIEGSIKVSADSETLAVGMAAGRMCDEESLGEGTDWSGIRRVIMGCRFTGTITGATASADGIVGSYGEGDGSSRNVLLNNANFVGRTTNNN